MSAPQQFPIARQSAGFAPLRRPNSVRRTTSIDVTWPDGIGGDAFMVGHARDIYTAADGTMRELARGEYAARVSPLREILSVIGAPHAERLALLQGLRGGGASRKALASLFSDCVGTPLYQILDDFAGASLVSGWIWSNWQSEWQRLRRIAEMGDAAPGRNMTDICTGFTAGASSLGPSGEVRMDIQSRTAVGSLVNPDDPDGWHDLPKQSGPAFRRARRIDVWREGENIRGDAGFQDSGTLPDGGRAAVHEYRVHAEVDPRDAMLGSLQALPLILPYRECPGASVMASRMVGANVADFRLSVLDRLSGTAGCTHLNDVLRGLADVPMLSDHLKV